MSFPILQHLFHPAQLPTLMPCSFWMSQGFREHDAQGMADLQLFIQNSFGKVVNDKKVNIYSGHVLSSPPTPNHELLLPHWNLLAKAANEKNNLQEFSIVHVELPASMFEILTPALQRKNLKTLRLCYNNLGSKGLRCFSRFLVQNSTIKHLELDGNDMSDLDLDVANYFASAVRNHPSLKSLHLQSCGIGKNERVLAAIIDGCKDLDELKLEKNGIGDAGAALITDLLAGNPRLHSVCLCDNNISDEAITPILSALRKNTNIKSLSLERNNFSDEGQQELRKVVFDTTSLNCVADSNHILNLGFDFKDPINVQINRINQRGGETRKEMKIKEKVLMALYSVNKGSSDLQFFRDVPLEFMHHVLAMIQKQTSTINCSLPNQVYHYSSCKFITEESSEEQKKEFEKDSLNRMFCVLRGWNLPLLFEHQAQPVEAIES